MGRPKGTPNKSRLDLSGEVYGEFTVLCEAEQANSGARRWLCKCSCGRETVVYQSNLRKRPNGRCVDCAIALKLKGDMWKSMRNVYEGMIGRCYHTSDEDRYAYYGGRGIRVCSRWLEPDGKGFNNFFEDMAPRPSGMSLDRIDVNGDYCKENCRWADRSVQGYNTRKMSNNTSGKTGVSFNKKLCKWEAYISVGCEFIRLGYFTDFDEACAIRSKAELEYYGKNKE